MTLQAVKVGEFWTSTHTDERVYVMGIDDTPGPEEFPDQTIVRLFDVTEGSGTYLGWRFLSEFLDAYKRMHTLDEAHEQALAMNKLATPQAGEFWTKKSTSERVYVMAVSATLDPDVTLVRLFDVTEGPGTYLGWYTLSEFLGAYERMHTLDEAHEQALTDLGLEACEVCAGSGVDPERGDADDYKGPLKCQACDGVGYWTVKPDEPIAPAGRMALVPNPDDGEAMEEFYHSMGFTGGVMGAAGRSWVTAAVRQLYTSAPK